MLANEKVDAYEYMKKAVSILTPGIEKLSESVPDKANDSKTALKVLEMKELMRDMHGHIINIDIINRILEGDLQSCRYDECKIYCNAIRGFDHIEGDL